MSSHPVRIAIDIGGTFTDIQVLFESSGLSFAHKTPTTPDDPSEGLFIGINEAAKLFGFALSDVSALMHGTTIATNAVLQRRFPEAALITTDGFEDVLEIGRHVRKEVYSQVAEERPILIARRNRYGVAERMTASGAVETALDTNQARSVIEQIAAANINVVAVSLLHAYANPDHEDQLLALIESVMPGAYVSVSSRTSPQAREFERTSTTVLNALLMPIVRDYLDRLDERMAGAGFRPPLFLVQSNGGVTTPDIAREQPVRLVLSGPSGGAKAAEVIAGQLDEPNLVAIDMGGTSFDVSVVEGGQTRMRSEGDVDGAPVRLPMLEIRTIGSGGGSLAQVDASGRLTVGPQSAGADPGPVAYGRGGIDPTVTDANIVLGRVDPAYFLGGTMTLDKPAAEHAMKTRVATPLGLTSENAAEGIVRIAVSDMAEAIRLSLFEKGLDPADFSLVSFGGAGGLHAALVADELGARRVLYPRASGTLSAWGMLFADIVQDVVRSRLTTADEQGALALNPLLESCREIGRDALNRSEVASERRSFSLGLDMRYPGQGYELGVEVGDVTHDTLNTTLMNSAVTAFHNQHQALFAHHEAEVIPEVVALRLRALGRLDKPVDAAFTPVDEDAHKGTRSVYLHGAWQDLRVYERDNITLDDVIQGPAIVEESHSTIVLAEGWSARTERSGVLCASRT